MPAPRRQATSATVILRRIGAVVLTQASVTPDADVVEYQIVENGVYRLTLAESRREQQLVRRMDGDLGLWFAEFDVTLRSLLRPPRLAWTLLVLSTAIGVVCLQLAKLSAEDIDE